MTIGRRHLVGLGALGLGAVALDGCGALPWARPATMGPDDVERLLAELDHVLLQVKTMEPPVEKFGIAPNGPFVAQGEAECRRLLSALCFMGTLREVPRSAWQEPRLEQRLRDTLPKIHATIRTALEHLGAIDQEEGDRIDERLRRDPGLPMRILEHVDEYAKQLDVPVEQRAYLRTRTTELAWRMRHEGTREVTTSLAQKYQRAVTSRSSLFGFAGDADDGGAALGGGGDVDGGTQPEPEPEPLRVRFHTDATSSQVQQATCSLDTQVTVGGVQRRIVIDWEEFHCPTTPSTQASGEQPLHATVHIEPGAGGKNVVTLVVYPPPGVNADDQLSAAVTGVARILQQRLAPATVVHVAPVVAARLGVDGESCRTKADCESPLFCADGTCRTEDDMPSSERLIRTTGSIAKYGAYLSIPPICAIGALVLLTCLFMVIVAGCMYAAGD
jgi:hypothetical protein